MTGWRLASFSTMLFTLRILLTEPTDVPPNFNTFISGQYVYVVIIMHPRYEWGGAELGYKVTESLGQDKGYDHVFLLREQLIEVYIRIEGTVS